MARTRENIVTMITKLMAVAMDESAPAAERELAQERADRLMAQHLIDRAELTPEQKSKIEQAYWAINADAAGSEFFYAVLGLMQKVIRHCGCRGTEKTDWSTGERGFVVVGFPEDALYAERMWFRVFREFVTNLNPQWDDEMTLGENTYRMRKAGFKWNEVWDKAFKHGQHPVDPYSGKSEGKRLGRAMKQYCESQGIEVQRGTQTHQAYRDSYASAFGAIVGQRLSDLRKKTKDTLGDESAGKFALALIDTDAQVEAEFYRLFPQYDPAVQERQRNERRAAEAARRESLGAAGRAAEDAREREQEARDRKYFARVRGSSRRTYDEAGWQHGSAVAKKINLNDFKSTGDSKRKEIN